MDFLLISLAILFILEFNEALVGPNVCSERTNYTLTTRVKYQQPVNVKTYSWCFNIPPRCSSIHTEMRERWKVQTEQRSKLLQYCCLGFVQEDDNCVAKCSEGLTGENCDEECASNKWGRSCQSECRCPDNSDCDPKNGKCICFDGWVGPNCDVPEDVYLKSLTTKKEPKLVFDWNTPIFVNTTQPKSTTKIFVPETTASPTTELVTPTTEIKRISPTTIKPIVSTMEVRQMSTTPSMPNTSTTMTKTTNIMEENRSTLSTNEIDQTLNASRTGDSITQIESPLIPKNAKNITGNDSPIIVILPKVPKPVPKEPKPAKATESSIISLTVLKSTVVASRKKLVKPINKTRPDSEFVKIAVNSGITGKGLKVATQSTPIQRELSSQEITIPKRKPLSTSTTRTVTASSFESASMDDNNQTEEIKHVLTEPEQITSVAGDEDEDGKREDLYSVLSVAMGVAAALILVATVIVLVARYRRSVSNNQRKMELLHMRTMLNGHEDELPSSYIRSVFHSPDFTICDGKPRLKTPFMQPVVIHAVSPIMIENFRDILESHYDHPKPPRPASLPMSGDMDSTPKNITFKPPPNQYTVNNENICFPVTGESINILKLEHRCSQVLEVERIEPLYDEIPWSNSMYRPTDIVDNDEAVTEL